MKKGSTAGISVSVILALIYMFTMRIHLISYEVEVIKDPNPTHFERVYTPLKRVKTIYKDFGGKNFLPMPVSLAVDGKGNLYIYDRFLVKILKFDKNYRCIRTFGKEGKSRGEMSIGNLGGRGLKRMNFCQKERLLISDAANKKILEFNPNGILIDEYPIAYRFTFFPLIDEKGNFYLPSSSGAVDVFNKNFKKIYTLLSKKELLRLIGFNPKEDWKKRALSIPDERNICYDIVSKNKFVVYVVNSSTIYLFENFRLKKQFDIFPKKAMELREEKVKESIEIGKKMLKEYPDLKGKTLRYFTVFSNFFIDQDNRNCFYLQGFHEMKEKITSIYKFDLNGNLLKVLCFKSDDCFDFLVKRNNLFYGIDRERICISKEE